MTYRRKFDATGSDSLAKLARWVQPKSTVLELGAAGGYFTEFLASQGCTVDIVEVDRCGALKAARYARRTIIDDLDRDNWFDQLRGTLYDTIVCADVLEHLRDGARLIERLRALLLPGGELLLSVPNVAHNAIVAKLVEDQFPYGAEGLLDATHIRLYTWRSLSQVLSDGGFTIAEWDCTILGSYDTEFRVRTESLAAGIREELRHRPYGFAYQWLVRAVPGHVERQLDPPAIAARERIPVRLLYARDSNLLSLDRAVTAYVPIGASSCKVEWQLPAPFPALRLLLADRIGIIRITECRLYKGDEPSLWSLEDGVVVSDGALVRIDATTFALVAQDAWISPAMSEGVLVDRMTATVSWPADVADAGEFVLYSKLAEAYKQLFNARGRMSDEFLAALAYHERRSGEFQVQLEQRNADIGGLNAEVTRLESATNAHRLENARLEAAVLVQKRLVAYRQSLRWWLRLPFVRIKLWLQQLLA